MAKRGRPTDYTKELADKICSQLSEGISLRTVCKEKDMPDKSTVFRWLREIKEFCDQYARAKEESADAMAEDVLDIADDGANDFIEIEREDGGTFTKVNQEHINRSRLRVDTRKWIMSKMKPKKYGEKVDVTSGGKTIKGNAIIFTDFTNEAESQ